VEQLCTSKSLQKERKKEKDGKKERKKEGKKLKHLKSVTSQRKE
jgi:hypothetical protein